MGGFGICEKWRGEVLKPNEGYVRVNVEELVGRIGLVEVHRRKMPNGTKKLKI